MRSVTFGAALLLACMAATPVLAGSLHIHADDTQGSLAWRDAGHVLDLRADTSGGIVVTRADVAGTWGLQQGDVILAVDAHPIGQIAALVDRLRTSKPATVKIRVRRGHAEQELTLTAEDYGQLIPPKPSVPPQPPAPPAAPSAPPAPPAPPSGG